MTIPFVDLIIKDAPEIPHVLDGGVEVTLHWLADAAEDTLASYIPAYTIVKAQALLLCANMGKTDLECVNYLNDVKYKLFDDFSKVTGLRQAVAAIIAAWRAIPAPIRQLVAKGGQYAATAQKAMSEVATLAASIIKFDPQKALDELKKTPSLLVEMGTNMFGMEQGAANAVLNMWNSIQAAVGQLHVPVLSEVTSGIIDILKIPAWYYGKVASAAIWLVNKAKEIGGNAIKSIGKFASSFYNAVFGSHTSYYTCDIVVVTTPDGCKWEACSFNDPWFPGMRYKLLDCIGTIQQA